MDYALGSVIRPCQGAVLFCRGTDQGGALGCSGVGTEARPVRLAPSDARKGMRCCFVKGQTRGCSGIGTEAMPVRLAPSYAFAATILSGTDQGEGCETA